MTDFQSFEKIPRLSRDCVVTEKIDGTNAQIYIGEDGEFLTGSRNRWITPEDDNYGFSRWANEHKEELVEGLGVGRHFGEWWGSGIQRGYGLSGGDKRFSLFNTKRWTQPDGDGFVYVGPECCSVVPIMYVGEFTAAAIDHCLWRLEYDGSEASPGFEQPEGIIVYHIAAQRYFKKTLRQDAQPKGSAA